MSGRQRITTWLLNLPQVTRLRTLLIAFGGLRPARHQWPVWIAAAAHDVRGQAMSGHGIYQHRVGAPGADVADHD